MILNKFNFYLMLFLAIINVLAAIIVPLLLSCTTGIFWYLSLFFLMPSILFTNTLWALIHEGVHGNLNSVPQKNLRFSRILAVLMHSNFEVLKFGHLMHHRYNRTDYDLTEGYESNFIKNNFLYYAHITIGIYLAEVIGPLVFLLPAKVITVLFESILGKDHPYVINGKKLLLTRSKINKIRIDILINISIFLSIIILYGSYIGIYLWYLLIRGWMISSVDNLPHYGAGLDRINGSFNLSTNNIWQKMILNFNYHRVHHKYPNLAWHLLPGKFITDKEYFDADYFQQYRKQWRGVISKSVLTQRSDS